MEVQNPAAAPESADPTQQSSTVPVSELTEHQAADADMAAAMKAFKTAMGASVEPEKAPEAKTEPAPPQPTAAAPEGVQAPEKASPDLTAILARMQKFEDDRKASESTIAELKAQLAERDSKLEVKDPIAFLKERGFTKEQVEDWLLNGGKSVVAQKSELEQLKDRIAKFESAENERSTRTAAEQQEARRAASEKHYRENVIGKALDAAKYPLLHLAHTPDDIVSMAYQQAVAQYQRSGGQEPDINNVLAGMEKTLANLREKLAPKAAAREVAPGLTELGSHSQAGTDGTEAEDDASAMRAAVALAKQILVTR